jgi:DNA-binding CsgD family transcriptional regulator/tetratricopeptide (TPR) repeat protein
VISAPVLFHRFVGRDEELKMIVERQREAQDRGGALLVIAGEAGIGKSRLVAEARRTLGEQGIRFAIGQCLEHARAPLAPFAEILRDLDLLQPEVLRSGGTLRAALGPLAPGDEDRPAAGSVSTVSDTRGQFVALLEVLRRFGAAAPTVVAVEDAHWSDAATLEFLLYLGQRIGETRLVVLVTYRHEEGQSDHRLHVALGKLGRLQNAWRLELGALSDLELRLLAQDASRGKGRLASEAVQHVLQLSEGNPLFAEELLKHAVENRKRDESGLPTTIRAVVLQRLACFDDVGRAVLTRAAVIGRRFDAAFLAAVAERPLVEIVPVLRRARDLQLIVEEHRHGDVGYAFRHALIREALYGELLSLEARPLHASIACALEALSDTDQRIAELAYHWWAASDGAKTAGYCERAGDQAAALFAHDDAVLQFERALGVAAGVRDRARLYEKLGTVHRVAGFLKRACAAVERAVELYESLGERRKIAELSRSLGGQYRTMLEPDRARAWSERALALNRATPTDPLYHAALVQMADVESNLGDPAKALDYLAEAERFSGDAYPEWVGWFYNNRGHVLSLVGHWVAATADFRRAFDELSRIGHLYGPVNVNINFANALAIYGQYEAVDCACQQAAAVARERFMPFKEFLADTNRLMIQLLAGNWVLARQILDHAFAVALAADLDARQIHRHLGAQAVWLGLRTEDDALIERFTDESMIDRMFEAGAAGEITNVAAVYAELYVSRGLASCAERLLRRGLDATLREQCDPCFLVMVAAYGDTADLSEGRVRLARWAQPDENRAGRAFLALFDAFAARNDGAEARSAASDAAEGFAALGFRYYEALALKLAGRSTDALNSFRAIGALCDVRRLLHESSKVNRRGRAPSQFTPRERAIAELVAAGNSNRAVAEQLVISERTVENHLASIFGKLNISSRTALVMYFARGGGEP